MSYLKKPKIKGRLNVKIQVKDDQGTTTEMVMSECTQEAVNKLLGSGQGTLPDFNSFSAKPDMPLGMNDADLDSSDD